MRPIRYLKDLFLYITSSVFPVLCELAILKIHSDVCSAHLSLATIMELSSTAASHTLKQRSALFILKSTTLCPITATSPLPTHTLLPRQSQSILSYVAPDEIVGYIDGRVGTSLAIPLAEYRLTLSGAPVTCDGGECVASAGTIGGCYYNNDCTYSGVCIDSAAFSISSACPYGCQQDPNTIKWLVNASRSKIL